MRRRPDDLGGWIAVIVLVGWYVGFFVITALLIARHPA